MTCKDCIHCDVCLLCKEINADKAVRMFDFDCPEFRGKADFVEVKHGEWIEPTGKLKRFEGHYVICSHCNVMLPIIIELGEYYYCPNCGEKMDGRRKENVFCQEKEV